VILFLALYPQLALHRSESSVKDAVFPAQAFAANPHAQLHFFTGSASEANEGAAGESAESANGGSSESTAGESAEAATGESTEGPTR
jgi:hypothetical protein